MANQIKKEKFIHILCIGIYIGLIWLPFGFPSLGALIEEWDMYWMIRDSGAWTAFPGSFDRAYLFYCRPLCVTIFALGYWIDPLSFDGLNYILLFVYIIKGIVGYFFGLYIFKKSYYAILSGILFTVFSLDTQILSIRNVHILSAYTLMYAGIVFFLYYFDELSHTKSIVLCLCSGILCFLGCLIYEGVYPLYSFCLLLYLTCNTIGKFLSNAKRKWKSLVIWTIFPVLNTAYIIYTLFFIKASYQNELMGDGLLVSLFSNIKYFFTSCLYRIFYDFWYESFEHVFQIKNISYLFTIAIVTVILILVFKDSHTKTKISTIKLFVISILLLFIGYIHNLISISHCLITQRTFFGIIPGYTLLFLLIAYILEIRREFSILFVVLIILSNSLCLYYQYDRYAANNIQNMEYLKSVASRFDLSKTNHTVIDMSDFATYLLGGYKTKIVCGVPLILNSKEHYVKYIDTHYPFKENKEIIENYKTSQDDEIVILTDDSLKEPIKSFAWKNNSKYNPEKSMFYGLNRDDQLSFTADSMWGYSSFLPGKGWSYLVLPDVLPRLSYAYAAEGRGTFSFWLPAKAGKKYAVLVEGLSLPRDFKAEINGENLQKKPVTSSIVLFYIPDDILNRDGKNVLSFSASHPWFLHKLTIAPEENDIFTEHVQKKFSFPVVPDTQKQLEGIFLTGWYNSEGTHIWSGKTAELRLPQKAAFRGLRLTFSVYDASPEHPKAVNFIVGKGEAAIRRKLILRDQDIHEVELKTPSGGNGPFIEVHIEVPEAVSPLEKKESSDSRRLGIALRKIEAISQ